MNSNPDIVPSFLELLRVLPEEVFNYKIVARPDRHRKFENELASTMDVALGILTACLNIPELKEQVKLMEERNMKPLDLNLAALSARCSKDLELNLAKSLLSEMGQCTTAYPYNQLFGALVLKNYERQDATLLSWNLMYIVD
ncbi:unnamed protein product [Lactuca virosa]|uniref:Exportin-1/Importin-beta-like domain-containing protein n=1 Tax=Lactuca virosa TaxID=75947 RepID=A0AAU9MLI0_9ASTR|nr:unnamed protein product [Lactuca virosa]